ncbi:hypothetical protein SRHO_G00268020 [Serrasalmus rhombeus]
MALFILLSFCLILEVHPQNIPPPQLVVSSTERGSVQLDCKTPSAGGSQCYFYPEGDDKNLKLSPSCQLSLTDSDLTRWTGHSYRSPEPVRVICYYGVSESGVSKPSPHSLPATVTVLGKKPTVSASYFQEHGEFTAMCEIPLSGSVRADFRCNLYIGHLLFLKGESRKVNSGTWICSFTASKTDLLNRLRSVKSREVSCDYSLISDPSIRSPMSDSFDISKLIPVLTQSSITEEKSTAVSLVSSTRLTTTKSPTTAPLSTGSPAVPSSSAVTKMPSTATVSPASVPVSTTTAVPSSTAQTQTTRHYADYTSSQPQNPTVKGVTVNASSEKPSTAGTLLVVVLSVISASAVLVGLVIFLCKNQRTDRSDQWWVSCRSVNCVSRVSLFCLGDGEMALFILLSFCLILEVHPQNIPPPQLVVSSTERGSVQLDCKTSSAGVSPCHFYPEGEDENVKLSPSCQLSLTDADLTRWIRRSYRSPEPVRVICFYTVNISGVTKPSPHSLPATVTVLGKKPTVSASYFQEHGEFTAMCEIPLSGSVRADFRCSLYTGHLLFLKGESRKGNSGKWICSFTASKTDLMNHLRSVNSREVSCDYSLISDPSIRSPMSDSYDILKWIPVSTQSSITEEKSTAVSLVSSTRLTTTKSPTTAPLSTGSSAVPSSSAVTKMPSTATVSPAGVPVSTTTAVPSSTAQTQTTRHYADYTSSQPQNPTVKGVTVNASSEKPSTAGSTVPDKPFTFRTLLVVVLSVISASPVLVGLVIFLCKKQRTARLETLRRKVTLTSGDQGDMMAMLSVEECSPGAAGTYSLITSVPTPSKPSGSTMPIQNWEDSDPQAETYSEITSTAAPLEPPGPSEKRKEDSKTESDVYHTYCTIPDIPVASRQNDSFYSLIQKE